MAGRVYKISCTLAGFVGLYLSMGIGAYAGIMGLANLANGGILILLIVAIPLVAIVWGSIHTARRLKQVKVASFIVPTIIAALGIAIGVLGWRFSHIPPQYFY